MNKYDLALRLDKARARGWAVNYALGGNPITGVLYAAEQMLEDVEHAAAQWRKEIEVIRAVMREIEAEKQPAEPSFDGPRYASGEQPMVGDIVCSDFGGERSYYAFLRPGRYHRIDARFVRELHLNDDLLHLVRRAEVAK